MELTKTNVDSFTLQRATVDVRTLKTQGTLAAPLAAVGIGAALAAGLHADAGVIAFTLLDAVLVGLITTEITGRYGSRLGTAPSVWAALIYSVLAPRFWTPLSLESAATPLFLLAVFGYLRYRSTREKWVLRSGLAFSALGLLTSLVSATAPLVIFAAEVLPHTDPTGSTTKRGMNWMAVALYFIVFFLAGSVGMLAPHMVPMLHLHTLPAFSVANVQLLAAPSLAALAAACVCALAGLFTGGWQVFAFCTAWLLLVSSMPSLAAAPLSIGLAALTLPTAGTLAKRTAMIVTCIGMVALSAFVILGTTHGTGRRLFEAAAQGSAQAPAQR